MEEGHARVVLLPLQITRLLREAADTNAAIGVTQDGSTLHVDTGVRKFSMDSRGRDITPNMEN